MARRMINSAYCSSDAFTDMSHSAQALYMQLILTADDDGFVSSPKKTAFAIKCDESNLEELESKSFIIRFESGCAVIKHWWCHNSISPNRKKPTEWQEELALLTKKESGAYTLVSKMSAKCLQDVSNLSASCQQNVGSLSSKCQHKLSKDKLSKDKLSKVLKTIEQNDFARGGANGEQNEKIDSFSKNIDTNDRVNDTSEHLTKNELFEMFWTAYPKKIGKAKCLSWFKAHKVDNDLLADMLNAIAIQTSSEQWEKENGKYIPHPYTWLNRGGWEDEVDMTIEYSENKPTNVVVAKKVEEEMSEAETRRILENMFESK